MGLWAWLLSAATLVCCALVALGAALRQHGPLAANASAVCPSYVEWHGPEGPVVRCSLEPDFFTITHLQEGDAVWPTAQGPVRQAHAMSDATRLALGLPLDINRTSAEALCRLPGISPRVAHSIVAHRQKHGFFATIDDLLQVHGVGTGTLRATHGQLRVAPAGPGQAPAASAIAFGVKREWLVDVVARLPQGSVSRAWGWLARRERPRVAVAALKKIFAQSVGITLDDAREPDMAAYPSLEALFVRRLRPGARPIDGDADAVVSPVDALCGATGTVTDGTLLQIKGRSYSLARLLGDATEAARYEGGAFATLYLAPKDYHRIHAPVTGEVREARLIPGALMPVFEESLNKVDELFARNERIITYLDTPRHGRVAVVKVGATLVGCIKVDYDDTLVGNRPENTNRMVRYKTPKIIAKGGDLGAFELGSTVVVLAEPGQMDLTPLRFGERVFVGRRIGTLRPEAIEPRGRHQGFTGSTPEP